MKRNKILIAGVWATNKGDRAIATFLVKKLKACNEIDSISITTNDVELLKKYMPKDVSIYPLAFYSSSLIGQIRIKMLAFPKLRKKVLDNNSCSLVIPQWYSESDYVIFTGGHHITSMRESDAIFSETMEMGLMCVSGKKYCLWTQTIGPLSFKNQANRTYFKKIIEGAKCLFVRDNYSLRVIEKEFGKMSNIIQSNDSVFGFHEVLGGEKKLVDRAGRKLVGLSIFYTNYKTNVEENDYVDRLKEICCFIQDKGFDIEFFPMETNQHEIDLLNRLISQIDSEHACIFDTNVSTDVHMQEISKCSYFVGHKTHSVIMALTMSVPLIALCYHEKTFDFMSMYGLQDYAIRDAEYSYEDFCHKFDVLVQYRDEVYKIMNVKTEEISTGVNECFMQMIECLGANQ